MRRTVFFICVMVLVYHAAVFELLLNDFSPLPSSAVWVLSLVLSLRVGNDLRPFSKSLFVMTLSFIIAGVLSYVSISYYMKETLQFVVQTLTMKAVSVSLLVFFTATVLSAFFGFMLKPRK
ncbi:hypothetical protein [Pseudothermotoga sp.]|nr:hypothetical protein [Pseudothermotoga sp.]MCX7812646.1 hypothetical protein [Pseudothermotoga sp.]MDW8138926.1 hypothetical protein [Pseudothermotoga sp.]